MFDWVSPGGRVTIEINGVCVLFWDCGCRARLTPWGSGYYSACEGHEFLLEGDDD